MGAMVAENSNTQYTPLVYVICTCLVGAIIRFVCKSIARMAKAEAFRPSQTFVRSFSPTPTKYTATLKIEEEL